MGCGAKCVEKQMVLRRKEFSEAKGVAEQSVPRRKIFQLAKCAEG